MSDIQTCFLKGYVLVMIFVFLIAIALWIWNRITHKLEKNRIQFWIGLIAVLCSITMLKPDSYEVIFMYRFFGRILCPIYAIVTFFPYFRQGKREALPEDGGMVRNFLLVYIKGLFLLEITIYCIWSIGILYFAAMGKTANNPSAFVFEMGTIFLEVVAFFTIYAALITHAKKMRDIFISVITFAVGMPLLIKSMAYFVRGRAFENPEYALGSYHLKNVMEICSKIFLPFYPESWMKSNSVFDGAWNCLSGIVWHADYDIKFPYDTYIALLVLSLLFFGVAIWGVKKKQKQDTEDVYCNGFFPYPFLTGSILLGLLPSVFSAKHWLTWLLVVVVAYYAIHMLFRIIIDLHEWYWKEISIVLFVAIVFVLGAIDIYDKTEAFGTERSWFVEHQEKNVESIIFDNPIELGRGCTKDKDPEYLQECLSLFKQVDQNEREERKEKHHSYYQDRGRDYLLDIVIQSEKNQDNYLWSGECQYDYLLSREEAEIWNELFEKWEHGC